MRLACTDADAGRRLRCECSLAMGVTGFAALHDLTLLGTCPVSDRVIWLLHVAIMPGSSQRCVSELRSCARSFADATEQVRRDNSVDVIVCVNGTVDELQAPDLVPPPAWFASPQTTSGSVPAVAPATTRLRVKGPIMRKSA